MDIKDAITLAVALGGWIVAMLELWLNYLERKHSRRDRHLFESLKWFTGKTQRRNVGIAVVEGLWKEVPHLRSILVPLLTNQAIYLLTQSDYDTWHERNNLKRIMNLLLCSSYSRKPFSEEFTELAVAVESRDESEGHTESKGGISVNKEDLTKWKKDLEEYSPSSHESSTSSA